MRTMVHEACPDAGPERDVDLLVEKGFLLLGSIEFQIDEHLMSHGTRIAPETRFFMARVRDAAGDAAMKMLDEARNRLETAPADSAPESADPEAGAEGPASAPLLPPKAEAPGPLRISGGLRALAVGRIAAHVGFATALAALMMALLVFGRGSSGVDFSGGVELAAAARPAEVQTVSAVADRAGEAIAAEWIAAVTLPAATHLGEQKPTPAGRALDARAAGPGRAEMRAGYPHLRAEADSAPQSEASDRPTLAEALGAHSRPLTIARGPYPDPRAGPQEAAAGAAWSQAAAAAEARLALSRGARREVQRRLVLARFDPRSFDGIFGPATRAAVGDWQTATGIPATGYLDAHALALLRDQTADAYRALQSANKARVRQQETRTVLRSPVPRVSPLRADGCSRTRTGTIVYGQGVRCDFRGLRQSIARLFG